MYCFTIPNPDPSSSGSFLRPSLCCEIRRLTKSSFMWLWGFTSHSAGAGKIIKVVVDFPHGRRHRCPHIPYASHGAGISTHILVIFRANVGKYSIHGAYGYGFLFQKLRKCWSTNKYGNIQEFLLKLRPKEGFLTHIELTNLQTCGSLRIHCRRQHHHHQHQQPAPAPSQ